MKRIQSSQCSPCLRALPLAALTLTFGFHGQAFAGFTSSQVPAFRGSPDSHFASWENFTSAFAGLNAPDDPNTSAPSAAIAQTVPGAILTGGNIYHPSAPPAFVLHDVAPRDVLEVVLQTSTRGAELIYGNTVLVYTNSLGLEVAVPFSTYTELSYSSSMGVDVESMFTWDLAVDPEEITAYELRFDGAVAHVSLDAVILDTRYSPSAVTAFCFGDGTGTGCPCGNSGSSGHGCSNGSSANGALLDWSGSALVANADLVLEGSELPPNVFGLFFQGANQVNGGNGSFFGDGLLCVNSPIIRLQVSPTDSQGQVSSSVNIAALGGAAAGIPLHYQLWYRDTQGGPCGSGFNTTNALSVDWQ